MKKINYCFTLIALILVISGCSTAKVSETSTAASSTPQKTLTAENSNKDNVQDCFVVINDEKKEIPVDEDVVFNEKNNAVAGIPTWVGGNIQLKIKDIAYDVCWGYDDLWLEKDGHAYSLLKNDLKAIVETATNLPIKEIYRYTLTADEKPSVIDDSYTPIIFNMLAEVHDTMHEVTDVSGPCVSFTDKLGANFDYYPESHAIYSQHVDAYLDASRFYKELDKIIADLQ